MSEPCELLSETTRFALREPLCDGVKVTLMVQEALTARLVPQVFVCAKSPGLTPLMLMLLMFSEILPVFVRVTV